MTSRPDANLAADLGLHAAREALNAIIRIAETAGPNELTKTAVLVNALTLLESKRRVILKDVLSHIPEFEATADKALAALIELERNKP